MNNSNINIIPIKSYSNASKFKVIIHKDNHKKSGVYRWTNLINEKSYVGSANNLSGRLRNYFSPRFLKREILKGKSKINSVLLKYGYENFSLDVLKYCDTSKLIKWEQYYLDLLDPEYNILKKAGSNLGFKHSPDTILKMKAYKHTYEAKAIIKAKMKGRKPSYKNIIKVKLSLSHITIVVNVINNSTKEYYSIREAARNLRVSNHTISAYIKTGKLLKDTYLITKKLSEK